MPLQITNRTITKKDDGIFMKPVARINVPYVPIYQWGYGRMDASSPGKGLTTARVASCIAVVFHCPTTGRTTLSHSPNFMDQRTTFIPMIDWVTGGNGEKVSGFGAVTWMSGMGKPGPREVHAVVMKGFDYASNRAASYGHEGWMKDFRAFFSMFTKSRDITADIVDAPGLPSGALTVDKTTGRITYLVTSPTLLKAGFTMLDVDNVSLGQKYSELRLKQDLFLGSLVYTHREPGSDEEAVVIGLAFDGKVYTQALKMTNEARCIIRSKTLGEPQDAQSAIIKKFDFADDWLTSNDQMSAGARMTFRNLISAGTPCERCGEKGVKKCGSCKGAWYCTAAHQKADWPSHKAWCKSHAM